MNQFSYRSGGGNPLISFIVIALILAGLFYVAKGIFWVLTWASPILLILILILDHTIIVDYFKKLWNQLLTTPFFGLIAIALSIFAFPVIIFYLFGKMMLKRKAAQFQSNFEERFRQYEQQTQQGNFYQENPQRRFDKSNDEDYFTPYEEIKESKKELD